MNDESSKKRAQAVKKREFYSILKDYKKMNKRTKSKLNGLGVEVNKSTNHYKLYYNGQLFILGSSPSDHRAGRNVASLLARA